jgi:hypothetical protein
VQRVPAEKVTRKIRKDITIGHEAEKEEQSDSDSEGATSAPRTSHQGAKESRRNRKNSNPISYSDLSYLNSLSRQERRRIEGEIIKGRKLGECIKISNMTIEHVLQRETLVEKPYVEC